MKTSKNYLTATLAIGAALLVASNASAGGFSFGGGGGGGGGGNKGGFKVSFHGNHNHNHKNHNHGHHHHHHHGHHHHVRYYSPPVRILYSQCYHPQFQSCYVYPGDTWYSISKRVYGVEFLCKHIASYNGLSMYSPLVPGQMLRLPVVNANGSLAVSNAPMPAPFTPQGFANGPAPQGTPAGFAPQGTPNGLAPQGLPNGMNAGAPQGLPSGMNAASIAPQGSSSAPQQVNVEAPSTEPATAAAPAASIRTVKEEPTLPRVAIGSTLMLDGESLGDEKGIVRLQLGALTLPVEVIEWTTSSVKISLPKMELGRPVKASLEVLRADGSLASKSEIELTPAATRVALGN
jgi:hypothetical protein